MAQGLMLDALNPPNPAQLVRDMDAIGASVFAVYVFRRDGSGNVIGNGSVTPSHVAAVQAAGKYCFGILVPGNYPSLSDAKTAMQNAQAYGIASPIMSIDIEQYSFPSYTWTANCISVLRSGGYQAIRYGDVTPLSNYPPGDGDWISHGYIPVRAGVINPVPNLPSGLFADQYVVRANINGSGYDVSVVDMAYFGVKPPKEMTDLGAGNWINIDGISIVAVVQSDGNIALGSSPGGLGGLETTSYLTIPSVSSDTREVFLGRDTDDGTPSGHSRVIIFTIDGEGSVYGTAIKLGDPWNVTTGWSYVCSMKALARVPIYQGQTGNLPVGPAGPPGPPGSLDHTHDFPGGKSSSGKSA